MNEMPNVSDKNIIDRLGSAVFEAKLAQKFILVPHSGNTDFGIDYTAEYTSQKDDGRRVTGMLASIQLKTHKKIEFDESDNYLQSIRVSTANYWLNLSLPVILVLIDLSSFTIYGIDAKKAIRNNYDALKMKKQDSISIRFKSSDLFDVKLFKHAFVEDKKYEVLLNSSTDSANINTFVKYFNEYANKDWFLLVDDYEDFTRDILALSDKYSLPFCFDTALTKLREDMYKNVDKHIINGRFSYDDYHEKDRTDFNNFALKYLKELTQKICCEIEKDKTGKLSYYLYKFKRLNKILNEKNTGAPSWKDSCLNALNCDDEFEE